MRRLVLSGLLLLSPKLSLATATATGLGTESLLIPALKMCAALALVVGLLLLFYAASRKGFGFLSHSKNGQIRMLETRPLGGKKFLCLVRVRDQELLLGVSNERIECLTSLPACEANFATTLEQVTPGAQQAKLEAVQ